ncbi:hypothetical protein ADU59_25450 [Pararhizobium polonicum]|uniref:Cellulose biosynthesis protein BcsN n=1 Tax=Pararhizobium polonicum TaxID=1612624 RepID=A0A1C7NYX8_9HYPH|nr:cellulose biosynthesis protein BcsN [Pararhizobium polonicum]OBZ92724.1 hypothetical protein ADU59_25450 [Pararhizobium polonicum]
MNRIFLALAVMMPLAACTTVDDPFLQTGALKANGPSLATAVSADYALAIVPGIGAASVRQTVGENHVEQTILYANATDLAGENALTVTIGKGGKSIRRAPSQSEVEAEMRGALSGVRMRVSPVIGDNAYGIFGYATGALGKGGSCIYAWQQARNITPDGGVGSGYAAQIRLRYCNPSMSQDRIAVLMQGLRIKPVSSQTFQTLRFAAGSGKVSATPLYMPQPSVMDVAVMAPVRPVPKRIVIAEASSDAVKSDEKTIVGAVKVPMPGEAAVLAATDTVPAVVGQTVSGKAIVKPAIILAPAAVASATE